MAHKSKGNGKMATYTVSSGQTDNGVALNTGDTMTVLKGGSAINTSITGPD